MIVNGLVYLDAHFRHRVDVREHHDVWSNTVLEVISVAFTPDIVASDAEYRSESSGEHHDVRSSTVGWKREPITADMVVSEPD